MLAIIPARCGSKGLPNKNIKLFNGIPLICHTIEAALSCSEISHVFVSTDCEKISKISQKAGAWVPSLRPKELAKDTSTSIEVYIHTLNLLKFNYNLSFESFIVLQPTSPLRSVVDINKAIKLFKEKKADSVISFTKEQHPIFWHKKIDNDGHISNIFQVDHISNRQEFPVTFYPNGAIYIFKSDLIINKQEYFSENSFAYIMSRNNSVDIDYLEDFQYAEFLATKTKSGLL